MRMARENLAKTLGKRTPAQLAQYDRRQLSKAAGGAAARTPSPVRLELGLLHKVVELLILAGVSSSELRGALNDVANTVSRRVPQSSSTTAPFDWWVYARVLSAWHQSPEFTDENGLGRPLPLVGRKSFQSLVARALPHSKPQHVLAALKALGAVRISGNRTVVPTSRSLIVERRTQMTLLRALDMCDALISTIHSNWVWSGSKRPGRLLFERSVVAERFDMQHLRAFDSLVRVHGQALLELLDGWLAGRETTHKRSSPNQGQVGVEIYLFAKRNNANQGSSAHELR